MVQLSTIQEIFQRDGLPDDQDRKTCSASPLALLDASPPLKFDIWSSSGGWLFASTALSLGQELILALLALSRFTNSIHLNLVWTPSQWCT